LVLNSKYEIRISDFRLFGSLCQLTTNTRLPYTLQLMAEDSSISLLQRQAIDAALSCEWRNALDLNSRLLELVPDNVEGMNRLAKAYCELGEYSQAKKIYEQVLKIDAYNSIAQKNLKKVASYKKNGTPQSSNGNGIPLSPSLFLQEPGVTKLVSLIKVAEPNRLLTLSNGSMVNIVPKNRGVSVTDGNNQYLGALPDDIAHHLLKLIKGGNKYIALIKSVKPNGLTILLREVYRSKKFKNQASFLDESKITSFSSDHLTLIAEKNEDIETETDGDDSVGFD
jgi:tetratricopeptide (TPR) repeat protein